MSAAFDDALSGGPWSTLGGTPAPTTGSAQADRGQVWSKFQEVYHQMGGGILGTVAGAAAGGAKAGEITANGGVAAASGAWGRFLAWLQEKSLEALVVLGGVALILLGLYKIVTL